jgi:hypothetical protein
VGVEVVDVLALVAQPLQPKHPGHLVLDEPGLVGVAQVVEVHLGLDRLPPAVWVAAERRLPEPSAEVVAPVQGTVGAGENEPGVGMRVAVLGELVGQGWR